MARMRDRLDVPVMCGVGAAFDFHAGRVSMAPAWMQERGLEWIYRIAQEPRRLLRRYLSTQPALRRGVRAPVPARARAAAPARPLMQGTSPSSAWAGSACRWRSRSPTAASR